MSHSPRPEHDSVGDGISRREFVQGRFWRALRLKRAADKQPNGESARPARRSPLVMRYPKSLREVAAGDAPNNSDCAETSVVSHESRRRTIPVLRPPGAIDEPLFLDGCTRCDECVRACPHDAIVHAPDRLREAAGTPIIDPDRQPCLMCEDFPCIAACEPQVLSPRIPKAMGTAKITRHLCLAHHGTTCTVCSERCVVPGAIDVIDGKPTVNETTCTGCGVCRYVCPAPENAILLMPSFLRPAPSPHHPARGNRSNA